MGKVIFDEGKLTVTTRNGSINSDGEQIVNIDSEEKFTIDADSIAKLLHAIGNLTVCGKGWVGSAFSDYHILPNSRMVEPIDEYSKRIDELIRVNADLRHELYDIKDKIHSFNIKKHLFWRPIKMED